MFTTEAELVKTFVGQLASGDCPWETHGHSCEFDYVSGRTDVVAISRDDEVLAFEAKLRDWRKALRQAWRNTSFANRVYVVLPSGSAKSALLHRQEFETRGVGLCLVDRSVAAVVINCVATEPVLPWLQTKARSRVASCA